MSFLHELKQRRVPRVALVYAAAGFAVIQAADVIFPRIPLPEWTVSLVVWLTILGFPIALAMAWVLQITPDGVRIEDRRSGIEELANARWLDRRTVIVSIVLLALGVGVGTGWLLRSDSPSESAVKSASADRSIAVLPFDNMSDSKENEYFSDGITEDIISQLAQIAELAVTSRTSVMPFKNTELGARAIAQQLGVAHILEGSVRRDRDKVRIVAQLIEAATDRHLWTKTYDRDLKDVFAIQSEVALDIAKSLSATLSRTEQARLDEALTDNPVAYDLYLRARELNVNDPNEIAASTELYRQAIKLDPAFAHAYTWLSFNFTNMVETHGQPLYWLDTAIVYARRALQIDPTRGHVALSYALMNQGHLRAAREAALRELQHTPGNSGAMSMLALIDRELGDVPASIDWAQKGFKLDPKAPYQSNHLAVGYINLGDFPEGDRWNAKTQELDPKFPWGYANAAWSLRLQGKAREALTLARSWHAREPKQVIASFEVFEEAVAAGEWKIAQESAERLLREAPNQAYGNYRALIAHVLAQTGQRARADSLLKVVAAEIQQLRATSDRPINLVDWAGVLTLQNRTDAAIAALEQFQRDGGFISPAELLTFPIFSSLGKQPRFESVVQRARDRQTEFRRAVEAKAQR